MDSPPPSPRLPVEHCPRWIGFVLLLAALAYGGFVYQLGASYAAGSDSSGYLNSARLLSQGQVSEPVRPVAGLESPAWNYFYHQPLGYAVQPGQPIMVPTYPVGLPLHYVVAAWVVGFEKTARAVNTLTVLAAGFLLFALGRRLGLGRGWAVVAAALLWACPIWIFHALQPLSDCVATTWLLAALLCALQARDHPRWALVAGAAFGLAVLVRPTSFLAVFPLAVALGRPTRATGLFILGGLPAAGFLAWYNLRVYGGVFQSGYNQGAEDLWSAFGWEFAGGNLRHFATWLPRVLSWPIIALALLGLPWLFRRHRPIALLLTGWFAAFLAFYTTYYCAGENWSYLRFLLPAFPAIILAALLVAQQATAALPRSVRRVAPAAVAVFALAGQLTMADELHVTDIRSGERSYWLAAQWINAHVPANAILLTMQLSGAITFYDSQPLVRWDQINRDEFDRLRRTAARLHRPLYAPLFGFEQKPFQEKFGGHWIVMGQVGDVAF